MIFFDTSAAAKYYLDEKESPAIRALLEVEDTVCLSELARVELMSVFYRRAQEEKWTQAHYRALVKQFEINARESWTWMPVEKIIIDRATEVFTNLPDNIFLRASDCLHLVTAVHHQFEEIYTYDKHQMLAAAELGLSAVRI